MAQSQKSDSASDTFTRRPHEIFLSARRYASAALVVARGVSVCASICVCLSQVGVLSKRLRRSSWFCHGGFLPPILPLYDTEIRVHPKIRLSLELCPKLWT